MGPWGAARCLGTRQCWWHCPLTWSPKAPWPYLQWHTELQLLSIVAEHTPGRTQQQVVHHLLLHAGRVLMEEEPHMGMRLLAPVQVPAGSVRISPATSHCPQEPAHWDGALASSHLMLLLGSLQAQVALLGPGHDAIVPEQGYG